MQKYFCAIMLAIMLISATACDYMSENDIVQAGDKIHFGNSSWLVLEIYDDNTALIIAENIMGRSAFHSIGESTTWETSDLRAYLNGEFLFEFTQDERARILQREIHTPNNAWYGTRGGDDTTDYIFLLSVEEVVRYFGDSGQLENPSPPQYGIRQWLLSDQYNSTRVAVDKDNMANGWWLRTSGFDYDFVVLVMSDGSIRIDGGNMALEDGGIRPALLVNFAD